MKDQLVGMLLVVESTGHEHYRTGHIAAAVGNCYLIQFDGPEWMGLSAQAADLRDMGPAIQREITT